MAMSSKSVLSFLLVSIFTITSLFAAAPTFNVEGSTNFERAKVERLVNRLDFTHEAMPDNWQITIWTQEQFEAYAREHHVPTSIAFTFLGENRTYVNEYFLIWSSDQDVEFAMGHEAGHLICECKSEDKADAIARAMTGYDDRRLHHRN